MVQTEFTTPRLRIAHWRTARAIQTERKALENALLDLLTPPVLAHLPPSLQLLNRKDSLTDWITARDAESDVLTVSQQQDGMLIGLMILAPSPAATQPPVLHLGYLLRETAWGQGYATEIVAVLFQRKAATPHSPCAAASILPIQPPPAFSKNAASRGAMTSPIWKQPSTNAPCPDTVTH